MSGDFIVKYDRQGKIDKGEWNPHNLAWFHAKTVEGAEKSFWAPLIVMDRLLAIFQLTLCTLVPILTAYSAILRT